MQQGTTDSSETSETLERHWKRAFRKKVSQDSNTPSLPLLAAEQLHITWLYKFGRQLFSTHTESTEETPVHVATHLLRNDPWYPGVIGIHLQQRFDGSCDVIHLMRADGLQFFFGVYDGKISDSLQSFSPTKILRSVYMTKLPQQAYYAHF